MRDCQTLTLSLCDDPVLVERICELSGRFFAGLHGTGYARCDLRLKDNGELFMLEINPNCAVFWPPERCNIADIILHQSPSGHQTFLDQILANAFNRSQRQRRRW